MGASWWCPWSPLTASCTPPCMRPKCLRRTNITSTPGQSCRDVHRCLHVPCPATGNGYPTGTLDWLSKGATSSFPTAPSTRTCFLRSWHCTIIGGHSKTLKLVFPSPWKPWETFAWWINFSLALLGRASCSVRHILQSSMNEASTSPPTRQRIYHQQRRENAHKSSHPPEGASKSSDKAESTSSKTSGSTSPQNLDSTSPASQRASQKCSPQAKEKWGKHNAEGCSSKHKDKDWSHSKKSTKHGSNEESDSTSSHNQHQSPEQRSPSGEHQAKVPCGDNSLQTPGTSSHQGYLSESKGNASFVAPVTSSTP